MCGIAGIFEMQTQAGGVAEDTLLRMSSAIHHRGPDDEGIWISPNRRLGLAFRRLSIIDLSAAGHQPMTTADGRFTIVFNGEVYNHLEIRRELEQRGIQFRGRSDTESILYGFREFGPQLLERLRGMWAIAIWDDHKQELFCARDRTGIKPLYFSLDKGRFLFASEIKAILQHPAVSAHMDERQAVNFLALSMSDRDDTLFKGIKKLRPGHCMTLGADGKVNTRAWWTPFNNNTALKRDIDAQEAQDEIMRLLRAAVTDRMVSDVPFGVFLSGGVDSSTNVALMAELMTQPVDTFTVGYRELQQYNELKYARRVAELFKASYHEVLIGHEEALESLDAITLHEDEPNGDPVCIPLYHVSQLTRRAGTTVIQVGEGSDEQFAGYEWMLRDIRFIEGPFKQFRLLPPFVRQMIYRGLRPLFNMRGQYLALDYLRRAAGNDHPYWGGGVDLTPSHLRRLLPRGKFDLLSAPSDLVNGIHSDGLKQNPDADILQQILFYELSHRLPEMLLMRVDKMTMAHSLEARVPFLDHRLVEFSMSLPARLKTPDNRQAKMLLKRAVEPILPRDIIYRKKQGFAAPIDEWMRGPLNPVVDKTLLNGSLMKTGLLDRNKIQAFVAAHRAGKIRAGKSLYALLKLALWHEKFVG